MTTFYYEKDADPAAIAGQTVAIVGYGNQGRPWALNLRGSGLNPRLCVRNDATRAQAEQDGFTTGDIRDTQGFVALLEHHSPASHYGQLSRRGPYDALDLSAVMRDIVRHIDSGQFADEWDAEAAKDYPTLAALKEQHAGAGVRAMEHDLMSKLGSGAKP